MTRALNTAEVASLEVGDDVARIYAIGRTEIGQVMRVTPCTLVVEWPNETSSARYSRETGCRLGCHGEVLLAVPKPETSRGTCECCLARAGVLHTWQQTTGRERHVCATCLEIFDLNSVFADDTVHVVTDLGQGAANVEPNDEARIAATVKADRARAKKMTDRQWLNAVNRFLLERLTWEKASTQEEYELQLAMATDGTEPHRIAVRDLAQREAPYYTAASLSAWVVRQRRVMPDFIDFTQLC